MICSPQDLHAQGRWHRDSCARRRPQHRAHQSSHVGAPGARREAGNRVTASVRAVEPVRTYAHQPVQIVTAVRAPVWPTRMQRADHQLALTGLSSHIDPTSISHPTIASSTAAMPGSTSLSGSPAGYGSYAKLSNSCPAGLPFRITNSTVPTEMPSFIPPPKRSFIPSPGSQIWSCPHAETFDCNVFKAIVSPPSVPPQ